ncbi:hypothetical protein Tco_0841629 [Tanacetum coccineum]|uniref:Reverse transcriptase domain-containing protein n=1 Tax=Tanacetum coccineum TaxID=301880 RepID=A0ABQ5B0E6_9ASTR
MDLHAIEQAERDTLRQKSRVRWAVEEDEKSHFFHALVNNRFAKNSINGIHIRGVWCENPDEIKQGAMEHFASRFKERSEPRPKFLSPLFRKLSFSDALYLEAPISMDEIKTAVWSCAGNKAPGPDSFNFSFIKAYWDIMKSDFFYCIKYFKGTGKLGKGCNPSFIVLIPKKKDLLANEIINMAKLDDQRLLLLKVDFEKAFDIVNWDFLHDIMAQMGFGVKWRKGLRQGDPLSLLLFLLVVEALQVTIIEACNKGLKVNLAKSRLFGVGVDIHEVELVASSINCSYGTLPFMYLGILVGKNMHFCNGWTEVIDRLRDRLSSWKAKNLSIGGRLTLVKSVLGSVPLYFLSLFKAPLKVIKKLESIRCRFFWGFKDGDKGKWKWSFLIEGDALWRKVIKSFYGEDGGFNDSLRDDGVRLMDRFPRLFALESNKDCFIFERWAHTNGVWRGVWMWRIPPCGRSLDDVSSLCSLISDLSLSSEGFDKWQWALDASGVLIVSKLCPFCELEDETLKHCLIKCSHVQTLWRKVWSWLRFNTTFSIPHVNIKDIAAGNVGITGNHILAKIFHGVFQCVLWAIWHLRNKVVNSFPDSVIAAKSDDVFPSIQRLSLLWISRRCHLKTVSWEL